MNQQRCRFGAKVWYSSTFVKCWCESFFESPANTGVSEAKFFWVALCACLHHDASRRIMRGHLGMCGLRGCVPACTCICERAYSRGWDCHSLFLSKLASLTSTFAWTICCQHPASQLVTAYKKLKCVRVMRVYRRGVGCIMRFGCACVACTYIYNPLDLYY